MSNQRGLTVVWALLAIALVAILWGYFNNRSIVKKEDLVPDTLVDFFFTEMDEAVIQNQGHPIEGATPDMYFSEFPGLTKKDFDGVQAMDGKYSYNSGELTLNIAVPGLTSSAGESLTQIGAGTLLGNVSNRSGIVIVDRESVKEILKFIRNR